MADAKEYGKLTLGQFRDVVRNLPEVRAQSKEVAQVLREKPERLKEVLGSGFHWAAIYERGFPEQIGILMVLLGWDGMLHEAAISDDPQERVLGWGLAGGELDQWHEANRDTFEIRRLIWLVVVLQRNILSIML